MTDLGFIHRFIPATQPGVPPLLLLHGTGGDENDLLPLGAQLSPGAALLSPRGKVLENGMPRFFRRLAEGVFDLPDLQGAHRSSWPTSSPPRARPTLSPAPVAVGFSNGANIAASLLLTRPDALRRRRAVARDAAVRAGAAARSHRQADAACFPAANDPMIAGRFARPARGRAAGRPAPISSIRCFPPDTISRKTISPSPRIGWSICN